MNLKIDHLGTEGKLTGRIVRFSILIRPDDQLVFDLRGRIAFVFEVDTTGSKVDKKALKKLAEDIFLQNYFVRNFFDNEGGLKETLKKIAQHFSSLGIKRVSFAGATILQDYLYLIRKGNCSLAFYRGNKLLDLKGITADASKLQFFSGKVLAGDTLGITAGDLQKELLFGEYLERLQKLDPAKNITLFLYFEEKKQDLLSPKKQALANSNLGHSWRAWLDNWKQNRAKAVYVKPLAGKIRQQKGVKALFVLLLIAFVASAVFTIQKNTENKRALLWKDVLGESVSRLGEAEDLIGLNNQKALDILQAIETKLNSAQKLANKEQLKQTEQLRQQINQLKDKARNIVTVGKDNLFYDLGLKEPNARGKAICLSGSAVVVSDTAGKIWTIKSGENWQTKIWQGDKQPQPKQIACQKNAVFLFSGETIARLDWDKDEFSLEEEILPDRQFVQAKEMAVFGDNLYFLHPNKNRIDKYLASKEGYQKAIPYLDKEETIKESLSLAIDGAVYLAYPQKAEKYLQGSQVLWQLENTPAKEINFSKIVTNEESDYLYLLDDATGEVYQYNKEGYYQGMFRLENGNKINSVAIGKDALFLLSEGKIYKADL